MEKKMDVDLLIALIESHPVLWDKSHPIYKERNATKESWKEICTELNSDFETYDDEEKHSYAKLVMKRWVNIRDAFNKSLKKDKQDKKSGSGASITTKYIYAEQLKFLTKIFTPRSSDDSVSVKSPSDSDMITLDNEDQANTESIPKPTSLRKLFGSRKRKLSDIKIRMMKSSEDPDDRHISFFKGIVPTLRTFTDDETIQFQMGVLQLITDIKKNRI